jgi:hypothetical protein
MRRWGENVSELIGAAIAPELPEMLVQPLACASRADERRRRDGVNTHRCTRQKSAIDNYLHQK